LTVSLVSTLWVSSLVVHRAQPEARAIRQAHHRRRVALARIALPNQSLVHCAQPATHARYEMAVRMRRAPWGHMQLLGQESVLIALQDQLAQTLLQCFLCLVTLVISPMRVSQSALPVPRALSVLLRYPRPLRIVATVSIPSDCRQPAHLAPLDLTVPIPLVCHYRALRARGVRLLLLLVPFVLRDIIAHLSLKPSALPVTIASLVALSVVVAVADMFAHWPMHPIQVLHLLPQYVSQEAGAMERRDLIALTVLSGVWLAPLLKKTDVPNVLPALVAALQRRVMLVHYRVHWGISALLVRV
jgi:hypothetical protein